MTSAHVLASLDDLGIDHRSGYWGTEPERGDGGRLVQVVRNGDIRPIGVVHALTCPVRRLTAREVQGSELRKGDVLVTTSGEPGKSAYWGGPQGFGASNFVRRLRAPDATIAKYVFYFLRSQPAKEAFARHSRGVAIKNLSRQFWDELRVPVRGVADMAETVLAIESYFTRLDHAIASLERVQAKLKAYRTSVLKAAAEGRLVPTEASLARAQKRAYEPAETLLDRILKERRRRWEEAELARLKASGKTPKDDKWKAKYEEPMAPETSALPGLPQGWCWASPGQVFLWASGEFLPKKAQRGGPIPVFGGNGVNGFHNKELIEAPTIVVGRVGAHCGNLHVTVGPSWITDNAIYAVGPVEEVNLGFWLIGMGRQDLNANAGGTGQPYVNQRHLNELRVPLPPASEQSRIVAMADALLSRAEHTEKEISLSILRCARLRQGVLKWAFEGKLADQDPSDPPVDKLVARIRAERAVTAPVKKGGDRRAKGAA